MAYTTVPTRANGQVIDQTWFNLEKANLDNLNTRLNDNFETKILYLPFVFYGDANHLTLPYDGAIITKITNDMLLLDCELLVPKVGNSGTLTVDIEWSSNGGGAWQTIFSTQPTLAVAAGDYSTSTNGVVNTLYDEVAAGYLMRLNIDTWQTNLQGFIAKLSVMRQNLSGL